MVNCRVCLKNKSDLISFFDLVGKKYLPAVVYNISGVKILRNVEPKALICINCREAVLNAEKIILHCQESEEFIQNERLKIREAENTARLYNDESIDDSITEDTEESNNSDAPTLCTNEVSQTQNENGISKSSCSKKSKTKALRCENCDFSCNTARCLVKHRKDIHKIEDDNIFPCQLCEKRFPWKSKLNRHIQNYHNTLPEDKKFLCVECGNIYINQKHLIEHQKQRHGPRRFRCVEPDCKQTFTRAFTLRRHFLTTHQNKTRYHCTDCDVYFKVYDHWKYHNKIIHNNQKRDFKDAKMEGDS